MRRLFFVCPGVGDSVGFLTAEDREDIAALIQCAPTR